MTAHTPTSYPNILQSFKITGLIILGMVLLSPVRLALNDLLGSEASDLAYYLLAWGIPFCIVNSTRRSVTGSGTFKVAVENRRVIPILIIATTALHFGILAPLGDLIPMPEFLKVALQETVSQKGVFTFMAMVMAAPVLEELLFRGIILDGLLRLYTPLRSIVLSSLLFGLVHLNPSQAVSAFLFGILTGWVFYRTRNLSLAILIHVVANLGGFMTRYFIAIESIIDQTLLEFYGGFTNLITAIVGSTAIFMICVHYLRKEFSKEMKNGVIQHGH